MTARLKIIAFPGAPNLPIFAAIKLGYFAEQGIEVELNTTPSSVFQIQAFHEGQFDIAFTAFDNIVAYCEGEGAAKLTGPVDFAVIMGGTQIELSAIAGSGIKTAQDLKGKTLALDAVGTGFAFVLYEMLEQLGLKGQDYERVPVGATPERWQSVKEGKHAGTITIEPFTSIAIAAGSTLLRQSTESFPAYQGGIVAARRSWLKDHAESAQAFMRGYLRGLEWTLNPENRVSAAKLLQEEMPEIKPGVIDAVMNSVLSPRSGLTPKAEIVPDGMRVVLELRSRYGSGGRALKDIEKYLDLSHYEAVNKLM